VGENGRQKESDNGDLIIETEANASIKPCGRQAKRHSEDPVRGEKKPIQIPLPQRHDRSERRELDLEGVNQDSNNTQVLEGIGGKAKPVGDEIEGGKNIEAG
jgi:hypothetical protein